MIRSLVDTYRNVKEAYTGSFSRFVLESCGIVVFVISIAVLVSLIEVMK